MKKALGIIFNVFWILTVGISSVIVNVSAGVSCCLTLVGIPFGLQHFKFIPLAFAPAGKVVVTRPNKHPVLNFLWIIFGGGITSIYYSLLGFFFMLTIVGYPIAVQLFKIASFCSAPFGAEIVVEGKYSSTKDTPYDHNLVATRILENPDKTIDTPTGASTTTRNYLLSFRNAEFIANEKKYKTTRIICTIASIIVPLVAIAYIVLALNGTTELLYNKIFPDPTVQNPLANYVSLLLAPDSPLLVFMIALLPFMLAESFLLTKISTAKKALYGKILSPGNFEWLINCYPDNTEVKTFFYVSPEKMLKKLNVALSRNASPTPVIIDELNYAAHADDNVDDIFYIADESEEDANVIVMDDSAEEITEEPTIAEESALSKTEIAAPVLAEAESEIEVEIVTEGEPVAEAEVETVSEAEATVETTKNDETANV